MSIQEEIWKDIVSCEGKYQASNLGRIKSLGNNKHRKEKILKLGKTTNGYLQTSLCKKGIDKMYKVHRLVAMAFIPNPENKPQVNHKDGNKQNNHIDNLEWVTSSENKIHAYRNNLCHPQIGSNHHNSKLLESDVLDIRKKYKSTEYTQKELAIMFNVEPSNISSIIRMKAWKHI